MDEFILKDVNSNLEHELESIGFDKTYLKKAVDKFQYKNIKIFDLSVAQANILKQSAISVGADCAVHRETITGKIDKTSCVLGGSFSQLRKISEKLKKQPFKLFKLADLIIENLDFKFKPLVIKKKVFDFSTPYLVGVLNLTTNSFSDGGEFFEFDSAVKHLLEMVEEGADIIEIGAESTKPFSSAVSDEAQLEKLLPILDFINEKKIETLISVDTRSACVAQKCIEAGADIINDVSGLEYDENMAQIIAKFDVPLIIQHSKGTPESMQLNTSYENMMDEIFLGLKQKIDFSISKGVKPEKIIVDPGIGFGKTREQNFEILERFEEFFALKCPIMIGVSRKSLLNLADATNEEKDIFTLALNSSLIDKGVNFLRVHNVKLHKELLNIKHIKH